MIHLNQKLKVFQHPFINASDQIPDEALTLPPIKGADLSLVTVFFNFVPWWISLNSLVRTAGAFVDEAKEDGGGGAGGGGGGIKKNVQNCYEFLLLDIR